jgi:hypothetical protein
MKLQTDIGLMPTGDVTGQVWAALMSAADKNNAEPILVIDWESEFPEIFALASSPDIGEYLGDSVRAAIDEDEATV